MKLILAAAALSIAATAATPTLAEPWVDYTPSKGAWVKTLVRVEPNKIEEYLSGTIKKSWVPSKESAKRHGVIDSYSVQVRDDVYSPGPNVALIVHYPNMTVYDPDKARDQAMDKEFEQVQPKSTETQVLADRAKFRTVVSEEMWHSVEYGGK